MIDPDWTAHRRDDGELIGWIHPADAGAHPAAGWVAVDLLGRTVAGPGEWLDVEAALDEHGIAWLAERWVLEPDTPARAGDEEARVVLFVEVTPERIVVKTDDYGAIDAPVTTYSLPWPLPARLRPRRPGETLPSGW